MKKSFEVTGIIRKPDCTRSDALYNDIHDLMKDVFGQGHMGFVEPTEDPFQSDTSSDIEDPDPLSARCSDSEYSNLEYSDIEENSTSGNALT